MSKKYDEFMEYGQKVCTNLYYTNDNTSMVPTLDKDLEREIRDRAIISLVEAFVRRNIDFTYGDIVNLLDDSDKELEYEKSKKLTKSF